MGTNVTAPLVVSLGQTCDEHVREFRRGAGPIIEDVGEVMRLVNEEIGRRDNLVLFPILVIHRRSL